MRKHVLQLGAATLLCAALSAESSTFEQTAATVTYDDAQTFGSFASVSDNPLDGNFFGNITFNSVPNIQVSPGQTMSATASIAFSIKAAPGYKLTGVGVSDFGSWTTAQPATVNVFADGSIVDATTGTPLAFSPFFSTDTSITGTTLAGGSWFATGNWFIDPNTASPTELTLQFSRTLSADATAGGNALIGNSAFPFGGGTGLNFFYSAVLIPEPSSYAALALGLVVLTGTLLKRRS